MIAVDFMVVKNEEVDKYYDVFVHPQTMTYSTGAACTSNIVFKAKATKEKPT